ncbi:hypothetical protein FQS96_14165 [Enterococcus faecalis]|uniref:hypothetical protein n=1 Tax=Enterococcus TaxID=1350 RepID=UPI001A978706|nr:hypothetical protein [Enterococcus faecalis]MBO1126582.1 hypothetical protein [Enterococcus faecalis]
MKRTEPLISIKENANPYLFCVYRYKGKLIGIEEDPKYRLLYELSEYGTPSDYFDWRSTQVGFGYLLDVKGNALLKEHAKYKDYRSQMHEARRITGIPLRRWRNRV